MAEEDRVRESAVPRMERERAAGRTGHGRGQVSRLDRVQDASISHPFPLSMIRDYGVLHLESAGEHAQERLEGGTHELAMTGSTKFYQALTDAQTPN